MALLTLEYFKVVTNEEDSPLTFKGGETVSSRKGKFLRIDPTTGKAMLGNASSAAEYGNLHGIAMMDQKYVGDPVTLFRVGLVDFGNALAGMDYDDPIYVSDTDGTFADAAGTVTTAIAGYVCPVIEADGTTIKKLATIDLR